MATTSDVGRNMFLNELQVELQPFIERGASSQEQQSSYTIFKVGKREREMNRQYFQHEVISLGLYDRSSSGSSNPKLPGDEFRLEIVGTLLRELGKTVGDWDEICREVVQKPEEIRQLYDEVGSDLGVEAVRNVLTLDALFLASFLGTYFDYDLSFRLLDCNLRSMFDPVSRKGTKFCNLLFIDILKLENQIPLALIRSALEFIFVHHCDKQAGSTTGHHPRASGGIGEEVQPCNEIRQGDNIPVQLIIQRNQVEEEHGNKVQPRNEIKQLDYVIVPSLKAEGNQAEEERPYEVQTVLHRICQRFARHHAGSLPFDWSYSYIEFGFEDSAHLLDSLYECTRVQLISHFGKRDGRLALQVLVLENERTMPSATKLHEAGIHCRGRSSYKQLGSLKLKRSVYGLLKITVRVFLRRIVYAFSKQIHSKTVEFKVSLFKAKFFLPKITNIGSESELLWRNLLAYEDGRHGIGQTLISYFHVMDSLINTQRDVVLLTTGKYPVIDRNDLGSEEAVANLYNSLLSNYKLSFKDDSNMWYTWQWIFVISHIHAFCNNKARQKLVEFDRTYLSKPWLIISILVVGVLLVLTFLQVLYGILSYIHRRDN